MDLGIPPLFRCPEALPALAAQDYVVRKVHAQAFVRAAQTGGEGAILPRMGWITGWVVVTGRDRGGTEAKGSSVEL